MKIALTTLSFGQNYTKDYTCRMIEDVLKLSNIDFYITTDCEEIITEKFGVNDRIKIHNIKRDEVKIRIPIGENKLSNDFNFNMRYLSLIPVMDLEDTIVIFTDCDNSFDWWDENMVLDFTKEKLSEGYDFFGPRTGYRWGDFLKDYNEKNKKDHGIFWHKIYNYDLDKTPKPEWSDASLPAEYLLIFVNKDKKLRKMVEQWKWFHDYLVNKEFSYGTWAEGFEIGVSALVAGFKPFDIAWHHFIWGKVFTANGYKTGPRSLVQHATER
jgi:hypothetical protein